MSTGLWLNGAVKLEFSPISTLGEEDICDIGMGEFSIAS
jgi:hypothetical protein